MMRVTNSSMVNTYLKDVQNNLQSMDKLNSQLNTNKQVTTVSDDPLKTIKILNVQSEISNTEKYNYNCDEVSGWLDVTEGALETVGNLTSDIKTLLKSISGTYGPNEIKSVQTEINEKMKQIGDAMNTTYAGKYVFGGSATDTAPVNIETDKATGLVTLSIKKITDQNGNEIDNPKLDDLLKTEISDGISLNYNLNINQITRTSGQQTGNVNGMNILNEIVQNLSSDPLNMDAINGLATDLDTYMNDVINQRTIIGSRSNTIESVKQNNDENMLEMRGMFSQMQDIDFSEKYIQLKEAEMVYTSSLQVGAKLIKPTLLDYLR